VPPPARSKLATGVVVVELSLALVLAIILMGGRDPAPGPRPSDGTPSQPHPGERQLAAVVGNGTIAASIPAEPPALCVVNLKSTPSAAMVAIDSVAVGTTPLAVIGVPCGAPVTVSVDKTGYALWEQQVILAAGEPTHLRATLQRPQVKLRVTSVPTGAQVTIDGKPIGKTPLVVEATGYVATTVVLEMRGFRRHQATVTPRDHHHHAITLEGTRRPQRRR
jgi:hypothetical protein